MDERRLYIGQLLRSYKQKESQFAYTINYRFPDDKEDRYLFIDHNDGIEFVIDYIRELEKKIDELQDIERIIKVARSMNNGIR